MTAALDAVASTRKTRPDPSAEETAARELVRLAREQELSLTGPDGLRGQIYQTGSGDRPGRGAHRAPGLRQARQAASDESGANIRNSTHPKTVLTESAGHVETGGAPRPRRQRRLTGVDEVVLSLYAKGLSGGEISAHFAEIFGASNCEETVSRITDRVVEEMTEWSHRPLDEVYAAVFIDAIVVKIRDGQIEGRSRRGRREVLDERAHRLPWAGVSRTCSS